MARDRKKTSKRVQPSKIETGSQPKSTKGVRGADKGGRNVEAKVKTPNKKAVGSKPSTRDQYVSQAVRDLKSIDKESRMNALGNFYQTMSSNDKEQVRCAVNPSILYQVVYNAFAYGIGLSDMPADFSNVQMLTRYILLNWMTLPVGTLVPRPLAQIWAALRSKTIGNVSYEVTFDGVTDGFPVGTPVTWPLMVTNGTIATGYFTSTTGTPPLYTAAGYVDGCAAYSSNLDLVDINTYVGKYDNDASVFAWDPSGFSVGTGSYANKYALVSYVGLSNSATPLYINEESISLLETYIKTKWMAQLRLCTPTTTSGSSTNTMIAYGDYVRRPGGKVSDSISVSSFPGPVMFSVMRSNHLRYKYKPAVPLQLKIVPSVRMMGAIAARLEATVNANTAITTWYTTWHANDIRNFVASLYRYAMSPTGGLTAGLQYIAGGSSSVASPYAPLSRVDVNILSTISVPTNVQELLSAIRPYFSRDVGDIYPVCIDFDPSNIPLTGSYTGTSIAGTPTASNKYQLAVLYNYVNRYKSYETPLSAVTKLVPLSEFFPTSVDATIVSGNGIAGVESTSFAYGFVSRRPITDQVRRLLFNRVNALSYVQAVSYYASSIIPSVSGGSYSFLGDKEHQYRQAFSYQTSGLETVTMIGNMANLDSIVPVGTQSSNNRVMDDDNESNDPYGESVYRQPRTLDLQIPSDSAYYVSNGYRIIRGMGKLTTYGNYGGPGWTAGTYDQTKMDMLDGKYIVPPTDGEDALYKAHDEEVALARGDKALEALADERLGKALRAYPSLSWFGKVASLVF